MVLTEGEIQQRIANGEIGAVTLDTNVFFDHGLRLETGLLARINVLTQAKLPLLLSDIVTRELKHHLTLATDKALRNARHSLADLGTFLTAPDPALAQALKIAVAGDAVLIAEERLKRFQGTTSATIVETAGRAEVEEVLRKYFAKEAPFGDAGKRKEFPDAFALAALEHWAAANRTFILVVSADPDWQRYCTNSSRLACVGDLAKVLSWVQGRIEQGAAAIEAAERLTDLLTGGNGFRLIRALEVHLDEQAYQLRVDASVDSVFMAEADVSVDSVEINDPAIGHFGTFDVEPLGLAQGELTVALTLPCKLHISGPIVFSMRDPVDKDMLRMGSDSVVATEEVDLEVIARFREGAQGAWEVASVELEPTRITVDLGHASPDWIYGGENEY